FRRRQSGLLRRRPRTLHGAVALRHPCRRTAMAAARSPRGVDGRAGEEAMRRALRLSIVVTLLAAAGVAQERPGRSRPPGLGPAPQLNLPPIQKRMLSNGLPVWVIERHKVPLVQANLVVLAGSGDDPAGKFGVASMTASMLDEGAGSRSALELADAV